MAIMLAFVFSSSSAPLFRNDGLTNLEVLEDLKLFSVETEAEAVAFWRGVDEAVGYEECEINLVAPDSKTAQVAFGKEESRNLDYKDVEFDSAAERIAFEEGVQAGEGWFDYAQVEDEQMFNLIQALAAMKAAGKELSAENLLPFLMNEDDLEEAIDAAADANEAKLRAERQLIGMTDAQKAVITYVLEHALMTNEAYFTLGDKVAHACAMVKVELNDLEKHQVYDNILSR